MILPSSPPTLLRPPTPTSVCRPSCRKMIRRSMMIDLPSFPFRRCKYLSRRHFQNNRMNRSLLKSLCPGSPPAKVIHREKSQLKGMRRSLTTQRPHRALNRRRILQLGRPKPLYLFQLLRQRPHSTSSETRPLVYDRCLR